MSAAEIAKTYSENAAWVPHERATPPAGELVNVLYADGMVAKASYASGSIYLMGGNGGMYRYVSPVFWQPIVGEG